MRAPWPPEAGVPGGPAISGHEIDLFIPDGGAVRQFGRRKVRVDILEKT